MSRTLDAAPRGEVTSEGPQKPTPSTHHVPDERAERARGWRRLSQRQRVVAIEANAPEQLTLDGHALIRDLLGREPVTRHGPRWPRAGAVDVSGSVEDSTIAPGCDKNDEARPWVQ